MPSPISYLLSTGANVYLEGFTPAHAVAWQQSVPNFSGLTSYPASQSLSSTGLLSAFSVSSSASAPKAACGAGYVPPQMLGAGSGEQFRPHVRRGPGLTPTQGGCFVEITSFLHDGESWTDRAWHIDHSVRSLAIYLNDTSLDDARQGLLALAPQLNQARVGMEGQPRAALWLRTGAHALKARATEFGFGGGGLFLDELPQAVALFTENPAREGVRQARYELARAAVGSPWASALGSLATAMDYYSGGDFVNAFTVIAAQVGSSVGVLGVKGVEVFRTLLDGYTQQDGVDAHTLADVPACTWERMQRVMFGLAA